MLLKLLYVLLAIINHLGFALFFGLMFYTLRLIWKRIRKNKPDEYKFEQSEKKPKIRAIDLILLGIASPFLLAYNFVLGFLTMMFGPPKEVSLSSLIFPLVLTIIAYVFPFLFGFSFYKVIIRKADKRIFAALPLFYLSIVLISCSVILGIALKNI